MKIQIWSPDQVKSLGGFKAFGSLLEAPEDKLSADSGFQVSPDYMRDLMADPQVKIHLDSVVEERTKKRLVKILRSYQALDLASVPLEELETLSLPGLEAELSRLEENLASRWKRLLDQTQEQKAALEALWDTILVDWKRERRSLLQNHEKKWCETLRYVIEKSCLNQSQFRFEDLEKWLKLNVSEFLEKESITIYVNPSQYETLRAEVEGIKNSKKWGVMPDSEVQVGQVRFESGNAGVIFDEKKNLDKFMGWVES